MSDTSAQQPQSNQSPVPLLSRVIATGFFSGYSPIAPGTAGSVVGLILYAIPGMENTITLSIVTLVMLMLGAVVSAQMERRYGEDPSIVVIDEVVGMWISLLFFPKNLWIMAGAFFLFRLYDIFKPPPARSLESLKNGWGIMMDDVAAAIYANLTLRVILLFVPISS